MIRERWGPVGYTSGVYGPAVADARARADAATAVDCPYGPRSVRSREGAASAPVVEGDCS